MWYLLDNMMFSNPYLENEMRKIAKNKEERGGWFFISSEPRFFPTKFSYSRTKKITGSGVGFINNIMLAPNEADNKDREYRAWDWDKVKELVQCNQRIYGWPIHFHTHPNNVGTPSAADYAFAGAHLKTWREAAFVIVTPDPLRLHPYLVEWGTPGSPKDFQEERGKFISWRMKLAKQIAGYE